MINYNSIFNLVGFEMIKILPREATKFADEHFGPKKITFLEIGVFNGDHAKSVIDGLLVEKAILIDPYLQYEDYKNHKDYDKILKAENKAHKQLDQYNPVWIKKFSNDAVKDIKEKIDFIYIDGNHDYEYVIQDLENYFPLVKEGGILAGHDIQAKGVSKAVLEFANKYNLELNFGDRRDWWIIK